MSNLAYPSKSERNASTGKIDGFTRVYKRDSFVQHKRAIAIDPNHAQAHYNLARAYALKNEKTLSIESLQKAITLDRRAIEASKTNSEFDNIRESSEFQQLINPK